MSEKELIDAGYHDYPPNQAMDDRWTIAYQKRFRREDGRTRYFVDVKIYHHADDHIGYQALLSVNEGCKFFPKHAPMRVEFWCLNDWTVAQLEAAFKEIHDRLDTVDYEQAEDK